MKFAFYSFLAYKCMSIPRFNKHKKLEIFIAGSFPKLESPYDDSD